MAGGGPGAEHPAAPECFGYRPELCPLLGQAGEHGVALLELAGGGGPRFGCERNIVW
jgi:hypothetical protein